MNGEPPKNGGNLPKKRFLTEAQKILEKETQLKKIKSNSKNGSAINQPQRDETQVLFPTAFVKTADIKAPEVRHEIAHGKLPYDFSKPVVRTGEPARTYPFTLDPFQDKAIACIERSESVLVSAHTSAGKTVVAEYAIAQSLKNKQRVIYTSPIKALSNQKYRELQHEFKDVGLMTGDVTLNSSSSCLVMTTEILRSMLYRGSEILREVAWVIFDEIHYMRDKSRGVVWEETIILMPHNVHFVFLSATIPNALEFAEWICDIHQQVCHVVYTELRPTPLQHYVFPDGAEGIYLVVDENGRFREDNFQKAIAKLDYASCASRKVVGYSNVYKLIKTLMVKHLNPVIAFAFSKIQCEIYAKQLSAMDFNTDEEKELVKKVVDNAVDLLSAEDRDLPWFHNLLPLLQRGIGVHHSGLIPFMKEVVELLFQEGLIKVLFATETFSMGLNMPAKTVVFCELSKFDGTKMRSITSGEYIQMSGRAGRRGLDTRGFVIMNVDRIERDFNPRDLQEIFKGEADHLYSAFHLKHHMILNMMRIEGISPEHMLQHSFYQFQNSAPIPHLREDLARLKKICSSVDVPNEDSVAQYHKLLLLREDYERRMREIIFDYKYCLPFIQLGRLARVNIKGVDFGWGVVVRYVEEKKSSNDIIASRLRPLPMSDPKKTTYRVRVLLKASEDSYVSYDGREVDVRPCPADQPGNCLVIPVDLDDIQTLSQYKFYDVEDLEHEPTKRKVIFDSVTELISQNPDGTPMDPKRHMNIRDEKLDGILQKLEVINSQIGLHMTTTEVYEHFLVKLKIQEEVQAVQKKLRDSEAILHLDELKKRKRLLRRLGYLTQNDVVEFKGRVACEITSGDELVLTELLLNGVLNDLSVPMIAAVLSCFVCDEAPKEPSIVPEECMALFRKIQETAKIIADVTEECNIPIDKDVYLQSFSPQLMDGVCNWCKGATFKETCALVNMFEGNIVRNFRSLDELLRAMISASKAIGTIELETKFSEVREKLRRGIIFAASLYL